MRQREREGGKKKKKKKKKKKRERTRGKFIPTRSSIMFFIFQLFPSS
jgi:hypothetical protein